MSTIVRPMAHPPLRNPWIILGKGFLMALLVSAGALVLYPLIWMAMVNSSVE